MRELSAEAEALWRALEVANTSGAAQARVIPLLVQLAQMAPEQSEAWTFAHRELAAHLFAEDPWRASICARRVLHNNPFDAMAWGILGLTQSVLGNHDFALRAYQRAVRYEPSNPWYSHNLGHLLDVAFDRPRDGLPHLERALRCLVGWPGVSPRQGVEMKASLAHALMRGGDVAGAHALILTVIQSGLALQGHHELFEHLDQALETHVEAALFDFPRVPSGRRVLRRRQTFPSSN